MVDYIGSPLNATAKKIAVTKGADCVFSLRRRDGEGEPQDWSASVWIDIDIDKNSPTRVTATVAQSLATLRIESTTTDLIKTGTKYRIIMSEAGTPTRETPVLVGTFERNDG